METFEAMSTSKDWGKDGMSEEERKRVEEIERNPQLKLGLRFMRSGATARRAKGRKPPQYLDLDADIKFNDVAGLGDIRIELEEIVDFFTYGEKYRRRGSKIPGRIQFLAIEIDCEVLLVLLATSSRIFALGDFVLPNFVVVGK